ncbi:Apolipoprotein N-acyltransferase [Labilithrix luteola]|uniref:Apolipoprotein N-acyltransferase n=1 Tax=Labilithrix luteola TaxID=1391654 RepID=A0A0K1PM28_9BACT|nr:apolipoprotein N-acyltransferase [Labilithrix luteola]AKU94593.1 Apolipoprotein N-acyltransferase [Labilithrix luteola]
MIAASEPRHDGDARSRKPRWTSVLAAASGALFATAAPPFDFYLGIPLGLVGFAYALLPSDEARGHRRRGAFVGWLFGLFANLVALRFVPEVVVRFASLPSIAGWTALVLLSAAQAIPWAFAGLVIRIVRTRLPDVPSWLAFGTGVYVATFVPAVFPWTPAGGMTPWPAFVQTAELIGERGTTFLIAVVAGLCALAIQHGRERAFRTMALALGVATAIVVVMLGWGTLRMRQVAQLREGAPHADVALVQPGFDAYERWDASRAVTMLDRLTALTKSAESRGAELTVWPESSYPYTLPHATRHTPTGSRAILQYGVRGPVLTGVYMSGGAGLGYNSAVLATADGTVSKPYDKRHLLWFGETVPLADSFPWLRKVFARGTGLVPGTESVLFTTDAIRAAVLNCYEDTLPQAGREAMEVRPNLLVNVTNDAWFTGSGEGELHLRLAALRAIEARRDLVRAVNQGPTSFVDATGRVRARYSDALPATLQVSAALLESPVTLFTRFGDAPLVLLLTASLAFPLARSRRTNR